MRASVSGRTAVVFLLAGVALFAAARHWLETRRLFVLESRVSLSPGHITTPEFELNLRSGYLVEILVEQAPAFKGRLDCWMAGCDGAPSRLKVRWTVTSGGRVIATGNSDDVHGGGGFGIVARDVGYFRAPDGRYKLDVDVLSDTTILDQGNPRLRIVADGTGFNRVSYRYEGLLLASGILLIIGGVLLFWSRTVQRAEPWAGSEVPAAPGIVYQTTIAMRQLPLRPRISGLPAFGFVAAVTFTLVGAFFWTLLGRGWGPPPQGVWVLTPKWSFPAASADPSRTPLVLRIDRKNQWFLNGKPISPRELAPTLRAEFSRRAEWVVYFEADPDLDTEQVVSAMDIVQGLHGRVVIAASTTQRPGALPASPKPRR